MIEDMTREEKEALIKQIIPIADQLEEIRKENGLDHLLVCLRDGYDSIEGVVDKCWRREFVAMKRPEYGKWKVTILVKNT